MNDEIKLMLNIIKDVSEHKEGSRNGLMILSCKDYKTLYDYITNLQQENKRLKLKYKSQKDINQKLLSIDIKHKKINGELREENSKLEIALQNIQEDYNRRLEEINYLNEELEEEKRIEEADLKTIQRLEEENEKLNNLFEYNMQTLVNTDKLYEDYKSRCEKASEYIEEHIRIDDEYPDYMEMLIEERDNLLNILQNGSEEK